MSSDPARRAPNPMLPVLALLSGSVLWGLTWLPLKYFAGYGIRGPTVTLVAHGSVGALGVLWLVARRRAWQDGRLALLGIGAIGGLANLAFATAIVLGDVVRVMILFYLLPVWGVLGGKLWLSERVDPRRKLGVVAALLGAFLVLGGVRVLERPPGLADVAALVSGFALAMQNVAFRKFSALEVSDKIAAPFVGCLVWAGALGVLGVEPLPAGVEAGVWLELTAFGLVWISVATATTLWGVAHMEAGRSSILTVVELLTAVISAAILGGRALLLAEWLGGGLIVLAAVLEGGRSEAATEPPARRG